MRAASLFLLLTLGAAHTLAQGLPRELVECASGTPERRIPICTAIIAREKTNKAYLAVVHNNRGNAYAKLGRLKDALADYTAAVTHNPDYPNAYNNRGLIHHRQADYTRAIADYDKALSLNPHYANAYNNRGYAYEALDKLDAAERDYRKALEIEPAHANARANLKKLTAKGVPL